MFAVRRLPIFPLNVIAVTTVLPRRIYHLHGITVKFSPSPRWLPWLPRYYRFPHYRVILYWQVTTLWQTFCYGSANQAN